MLEHFSTRRSALLFFAFLNNFFAFTCTASFLVDSPFQEIITAAQIPTTSIFSFPNGNQAENIRPRRNGQLLVTINTSPELYQIDPFHTQSGSIVHTFQGYKSLFGIVELQDDVFYVIASNFTGAPDYYGFPGSVSILRVDLRGIPDPTAAPVAVGVSKIVDIPQAQLLDGFAVVNKTAGLLVSGDAQTGTVYLIDVHKRTATAVLQDPLLQGTSTGRAPGFSHLGINGVKVYGGDMYFTNTAKGTYGVVPLNGATGVPAGNPSILASYGTITDDLSFDLDGNAFISEPLVGVLLRPAHTTPADNRTRLISSLYGANSNAFGRTARDSCILYSTFGGPTSGIARIDVGTLGLCDVMTMQYE